MENTLGMITSECKHFVCSECHTKTGYPHQKWCPEAGVTDGKCRDCAYRRESGRHCGHPYMRKGGDVK